MKTLVNRMNLSIFTSKKTKTKETTNKGGEKRQKTKASLNCVFNKIYAFTNRSFKD